MGIEANLNRLCRGKRKNRRNAGRSMSGHYASLIVGPAFGLTVMCAHAQTASSGTAAGGTGDTGTATSVATPGAPRSTGIATLNTVEVTANRRREPAREVPMQVNVLGAQELQRKGDQSIRDYLKEQPGVSLVAGANGAGSNQIAIRGITTSNNDVGPTVGVYVDDVPFGSSTLYGGGAQYALDMGLLDLNHVEVLRGPQGTLYGAGAMGGLLKYVTNEPDSEDGLSGHAGVVFSGTDHGSLNHTEDAVVNAPIKEGIAALRVSAFNQQDGGYTNRVGADPERDVNDTTTRGGRASLEVTPTKDLTIRLTATTQQVKSDGTGLVDYDFATRKPLYGDFTQSRQVNEPYDQLIELYSANIEYDFGWARLNAISAYQTIRTSYTSDLSSAYVPLLNSEFGGPIFTTAQGRENLSTRNFTQELRLTSPISQKLEWIAGLFYTNQHSLTDQLVDASGPGTSLNLLTAHVPSTYEEYAGYGDLTYHFTSRLSATVGLRVAHNNQTYNQAESGALVGPANNKVAESGDTSKTYLFTLSYLLDRNSSVYGRVASGYRPGGPQPSVLDPVTGKMTASSFNPDTLTSYEIGYKADLLDKRASLSLSAFDIEWRNIQLDSSVNGLSVITNGGHARSRGLEFFGSLNPTSQWRLSTGLSYTDARLTEDVPGIGALSGERLPNTAAFTATVNADYLFTLGKYRTYAGITEAYIGPRNSGYTHSLSLPNFELPGYFETDLRAGIDLQVANVSLFVHNLFNRGGMQSVTTNFLPLGGPAQVSFIQPLTVGMEVNVPF